MNERHLEVAQIAIIEFKFIRESWHHHKSINSGDVFLTNIINNFKHVHNQSTSN